MLKSFERVVGIKNEFVLAITCRCYWQTFGKIFYIVRFLSQIFIHEAMDYTKLRALKMKLYLLLISHSQMIMYMPQLNIYFNILFWISYNWQSSGSQHTHLYQRLIESKTHCVSGISSAR